MTPIFVKGNQGSWPDSDRYLGQFPSPRTRAVSPLSAADRGLETRDCVLCPHPPGENGVQRGAVPIDRGHFGLPHPGGSDFKVIDESWGPALYQDGETHGWECLMH